MDITQAWHEAYKEAGWISSKEKWPSNNTRVLVVAGAMSRFPEDRMVAVAHHYEGVFTLENLGRKPVGGEVFWMPLPELPYVGKHEKR